MRSREAGANGVPEPDSSPSLEWLITSPVPGLRRIGTWKQSDLPLPVGRTARTFLPASTRGSPAVAHRGVFALPSTWSTGPKSRLVLGNSLPKSINRATLTGPPLDNPTAPRPTCRFQVQPSVASITEGDEIGCTVIDLDRSWHPMMDVQFGAIHGSASLATVSVANQGGLPRRGPGIDRETGARAAPVSPPLLPASVPWSRRANDSVKSS